MTVSTSGQTVDPPTGVETAPAPSTTGTRAGAATLFLRAAAVLLLVPVALYFWFIHRYGVNAIYYDQWNDVGLLTHSRYFSNSYSHTTVGALWAQHAENRTFFPNLIVLALGALTNLNTVTEMYLGAVLLVISLVLIILARRQDVARARLVFYLPVAFLVFTLGQYENTLFGYQLWLYLVIATLAATLYLLNLPRLSWLLLVGAIAMAVIGSYSAVDGLCIWPAGLVVLLWKRRPRAFVVTWLISAVATTLLYFYHYNFTQTSGGSHTYVLEHPWSSAEFFFFAIGDLMGQTLPSGPGGSNLELVAIGVAVFLLAGVCLAIYGRRRSLSSPVGPALICFGVVLAILVTSGRTHLGLEAASQSRFVTEDLLILVGCYLCLLERWPAHDRESVTASLASTVDALRKDDRLDRIFWDEWRQGLLVALRFVAILLIVVEVEGGIANGLPSGAATRRNFQFAQLVAAHAAEAPDPLIKAALFPNVAYAYAHIRALAEAAKRDHLSFFATSEATRLERTSLPNTSYPPPKISTVLVDGTVLHGRVYLVAKVSSDYPLTSVDFQITNPGGQRVELLHGVNFPYGYFATWHTTNLPNGTYTVQSTAEDIGGRSSTSKAVSVTVEN
jgi:hypothetical protein